jgi:two-component system, OmpR family, phosphate regulon sensor histidine kinase PhoR
MSVRTKLLFTGIAAVTAAVIVALWIALRTHAVSSVSTLVAAAGGVTTGWIVFALVSVPLTRRLRRLDERAKSYAEGSSPQLSPDSGHDEIGSVAQILDSLTLDLRRRLASLEADRARMAAILSGMIEGVIVVNEHGRLQLANEAARRMLHIDDAAEGRQYPEIVRHPAVAQQIAAALAGSPTESVELTGLRDPSVTLIARTAPVDISRGRGAVVVLHDISDLRRADMIRRDFVANVSHELRTPLTAIRGYVEALDDATTDERKRFLQIISRQTLRMERLVRDLLRLAKLDARQEILDRRPCRLGSILDLVELDLGTLLSSRGQTIERDLTADANEVTADAAKLQDVFRNLIENAANYSPEGSRIAVSARRTADRVRIEIADEGRGIPEPDLPRVFERFYRVDKSRTRGGTAPGGTGLGLAIVKHLVEMHGGTVAAANGASGGAVFTLELPA